MHGHNHLPDVVIINGKKQSGKSTTSSYLAEVYGYEVIRFADPLKDMLRVMLRYCDFDDETIERCIMGDLKEAPHDILGGNSTRVCMQTLGTEWRKMVNNRLWVDIAINRVNAILASGKRVIIDDLRLPEEFDGINDLESTADFSMHSSVKLKIINPRTAYGGATGKHYSEIPLPDHLFDMVIQNDGSIEHLYAQVEAALFPAQPLNMVG